MVGINEQTQFNLGFNDFVAPVKLPRLSSLPVNDAKPKVPNHIEISALVKAAADAVSFTSDSNKLAVAGLLTQIKELAMRGSDHNATMNSSLEDMYKSYRDSVCTKELRSNNNKIAISDPKPATQEYLRNQPVNRMKSSNERRSGKRKSQTTNNSSIAPKKNNTAKPIVSKKASPPLCSFCRTPHQGNIKRCPLLLEYGNEVCWDSFRTNLIMNYPISTEPKTPRYSNEEKMIYNHPKYHFVLKSLAPRNNVESNCSGCGSDPKDLIIVVDLLNRSNKVFDDVLPGRVSKEDVCLLAEDFLNKYGSFPNNLNIIDAIEKHSIGRGFRCRKNIHSYGINRSNDVTPISSSNAFPRYSNINFGGFDMSGMLPHPPVYPQMPVNYQNRPLNTAIGHIQNHNNMIFGSASQHQIQGYHGTAPDEAVAYHAQNSYNNDVWNCNNHHTQGTIAVGTAINSQNRWDS